MSKKPHQSDAINRYPSPSEDPEFKKYWNSYIEAVTSRDNFKEGHLFQLEMLCKMHQEYKKLEQVLEVTGHTYMSESGRYGQVIKKYPEVDQMNKVRDQIAAYIKMLGLTLTKDTAPSDKTEGEEWD